MKHQILCIVTHSNGHGGHSIGYASHVTSAAEVMHTVFEEIYISIKTTSMSFVSFWK